QIDFEDLKRRNVDLKLGSKVVLQSDQYFSGSRDSRIISISRKINNPFEMDIDCSNAKGKTKLEGIQNSVDELNRVVAEQMNYDDLDVLKTWDAKDPTNYNVFSALRSLQQFINKKGDKVSGIIDFLSDIKVKGEAEINSLVSIIGAINTLTADDIDSSRATIRDAVVDLLKSDNITAKLIRSSSYAGGPTGHGYSINNDGEAELKSLFIREFLEAAEFRYNRVTVIAGESWRGPGAGLIKSVDTELQTITLKLEEGELASIDIDDICKAIYHTTTGFGTAFFRITEKVTEDTFKYVLRSGYSMHPKVTMSFIAYGNFTNKSRQQSCYEARNYKRYLANVNDWDIKLSNIMMQLGDLSNLKTEYGLDMTGYSAYLNYVYLTGTIKQLSQDGVTEVLIPAFKGAWAKGKFFYYDEVTHNGSRWICIAKETEQEPDMTATDWLRSAANGESTYSAELDQSDSAGYYREGQPYRSVTTVRVMYGTQDITDTLDRSCFHWLRSTGDPSDETWNATHRGIGNSLELTQGDLIGDTTIRLKVYSNNGPLLL
ncbi:MAG: hypothetical protein ACRCZQ_12250, partial [Bacteroidales bacterium]